MVVLQEVKLLSLYTPAQTLTQTLLFQVILSCNKGWETIVFISSIQRK